MTTISKKDRLLNTLRAGKRITADQALTRFRFASRNAVYATISQLRRAGYDIVGQTNKSGTLAYSF